jgi:hypothetical protein
MIDINDNEKYTGHDIRKLMNDNLVSAITHYSTQIQNDKNYSGFAIKSLLKDIKDALYIVNV